MASTPGTIDTDIPSQWDGGFIADIHWTPHAAVSGWRLEMTFAGELANIWNAQILERTGDTYVIGNLAHNADLAAGQTIGFGFEAAGSPADLAFDTGGEPPAPPQLEIAGATVPEGDPGEDGPAGSVMGPLATRGNDIVNAAGETVQIEAVNWFGLETDTHAPHGLWTRNWQAMMDEIKAVGFNAIRLPFSLAAVLDPDAVPNGIDFGANPDLAGLGGLDILDKIVGYAEQIGLGIILDNHRSAAGDGPNGNGLWHDGPYGEDDWIAAWTMLAQRYGDSPAIIGADLANEPHGAAWDAWASAAERAGNAILGQTDNWLVIVEGVASHDGASYWWGGNLQGVADRPVVLSAPDKLVYSPHDYPASVYDQPWFHDGSDLYEVFRQNWGFIHEADIAPILVGEFGSRLATALDRTWAEAIVNALGGDLDGDGTAEADPMHFAWWSWNPNSSDTGGILQDDWRTIRQDAVDLLAPLLDDAGGSGPATIRFTVSLSHAATSATEVRYATADRTAHAGEDYLAARGTLVFAPGETRKYVDVTVLPDGVVEADERFVLNIAGPDGKARAIGRITDDDTGPPAVSVAAVRVGEGDGWAEITARLSAPSADAVKVRYLTSDAGADAGADYTAAKGTFRFAPGETEATARIAILDDDVAEAQEAFLVRLKAIDNAVLADTRARVRIVDDDGATPEGAFDAAAAGATLAASDEYWGV